MWTSGMTYKKTSSLQQSINDFFHFVHQLRFIITLLDIFEQPGKTWQNSQDVFLCLTFLRIIESVCTSCNWICEFLNLLLKILLTEALSETWLNVPNARHLACEVSVVTRIKLDKTWSSFNSISSLPLCFLPHIWLFFRLQNMRNLYHVALWLNHNPNIVAVFGLQWCTNMDDGSKEKEEIIYSRENQDLGFCSLKKFRVTFLKWKLSPVDFP